MHNVLSLSLHLRVLDLTEPASDQINDETRLCVQVTPIPLFRPIPFHSNPLLWTLTPARFNLGEKPASQPATATLRAIRYRKKGARGVQQSGRNSSFLPSFLPSLPPTQKRHMRYTKRESWEKMTAFNWERERERALLSSEEGGRREQVSHAASHAYRSSERLPFYTLLLGGRKMWITARIFRVSVAFFPEIGRGLPEVRLEELTL